jgi:hypothetical protein
MSSEVKCLWEKAPFSVGNVGISIPGRVRLLGYSTAAGVLSAYTLSFKNSDSSGATGLEVGVAGVNWADQRPYKRIPAGGILFPDGLYFSCGNSADGSSTLNVRAITLVYQDG